MGTGFLAAGPTWNWSNDSIVDGNFSRNTHEANEITFERLVCNKTQRTNKENQECLLSATKFVWCLILECNIRIITPAITNLPWKLGIK